MPEAELIHALSLLGLKIKQVSLQNNMVASFRNESLNPLISLNVFKSNVKVYDKKLVLS